ncbi:MAG: hypothetical protein F6K30_24060 [Cyanothece sp. SIO2G6]|nr:hypothetical protein [Cyanothece sp. SIO2G6]
MPSTTMADIPHSPDPSSIHSSPGRLSSDQLSPENERSLKTLLRTIERTREDEFTLKLVRCNYASLRHQVMQRLKQDCPLEIEELWLDPFTSSLTEAIATAQVTLAVDVSSVLSIHGIEQVADLKTLLTAANQSRDSLQQHLSLPVILWVTDDVTTRMVRDAPDLWNFIPHPVTFRPLTSELVDILQTHTQQLWDTLLQPTGALFPQQSDPQQFDRSDPLLRLSRGEVEVAQRDLSDDEYELSPELNASLQLVLGREQFWQRSQSTLAIAIQHYRDSLDFWQTQNDPAKVGILQVHLGWCCWQQAEGDRAHQRDHWHEAERHFRAGLAAFEQSDHFYLKARFIGYLGETLKRLTDWEALEIVTEAAIALHQTDDYYTELAQDYGFKAELGLKHTQEPEVAQDYAQQALNLLEQSSDESHDRGLFLLLLAQAEHQLGQVEVAIVHLREARRLGRPQNHPRLYITILNELQSLYFEQKEYQTAFEFKRETIAIESQYGFRAFIGAARLRPQRSTTPQRDIGDEVAPEIAVSGRQQDVDNLKERIIRDRHRLTILHGPLGVGKSSILQAGLIPSLRRQRVDTRRILAVMTRTYTDCEWTERLGENLVKQLQDELNIAAPPLQSSANIITQLKRNHDANLVTVLIFDQFEEFFFNCKNINERKTFFTFLNQCLNQVFSVNVILSLREDYLHYLLEWERYEKNRLIQEQRERYENNRLIQNQEIITTTIYDNILSQDHRYTLGNFSPADAKAILKKLSDRAQFYIEEELCDRLVQDLTDNDEVKPIELQVIGVQLQSEEIITLEAYQSIGENQREILVQAYLESIIQDCGSKNQNAANLILYALTDENNTRPLKTRHEIETEIQNFDKGFIEEISQIDVILNIFKESGLIFLIPEIPDDRYQLIHDYLVSFIRKQKSFLEEIANQLRLQREELTKKNKELEETQNKLRISELEMDIRAKENINLKKDIEIRKARQKIVKLTLLIFFLVIGGLVFSTFYFIKVEYDNTYQRDDENNIQNLKRATLHIRKAEDLVYFKESEKVIEDELILFELVQASVIILFEYEKESRSPIQSWGTTPKPRSFCNVP